MRGGGRMCGVVQNRWCSTPLPQSRRGSPETPLSLYSDDAMESYSSRRVRMRGRAARALTHVFATCSCSTYVRLQYVHVQYVHVCARPGP